ncbi:MAG: ROK family protein [Eubacteriales bacterium]|nr:ROK family protein [Eubacteriales bacterium]
MEQYYLILDIGGTKTTGAVFTKAGEILDDYTLTVQSQTFKGEEAVYQNTKQVLLRVMEHFGLKMEQVRGIGAGSPGPLNTREGIIVHAPLMGWKNFPIVRRLQEDFGKPVVLDNDGNLGALAEHRRGLGKGSHNLLYMTVSTGIGGGIILQDQIHHGRNDGAGEFGHMAIIEGGLACPCGSQGCFEMYASGTALNRRMRMDQAKGVESLAFTLAREEGVEVEGRHLAAAAANGDAYACMLYQREGQYLGVGIANLFNLYDPEVFVLGGGVTKAKQYFHQALMTTLQSRCINPVSEEQIRYSVMNDRVVLYGAYYLIHEAVNA